MARPRLPMSLRKPPGTVTQFVAPTPLKKEFLKSIDATGVTLTWVFESAMRAMANDPDGTLTFLRQARKAKEV
jgi:hypothetical protein